MKTLWNPSSDVSIIIPVFNEEYLIQEVLRGIFRQNYIGNLDIIVVDGGSTDKTLDKINGIMPEMPPHIQVRILNNPKKHIPVALNMAAQAAKGDILIRLDGHTIPPKDFVSRSLKALESAGGKAIVGGRWQIMPKDKTPWAKAIALAVAHPVGIGNAAYRTYKQPTEIQNNLLHVDTVPFGACPKSLWKELGGYDENLLTSEDYDFALRARQKGYQVLMDPNLVLKYFSRSNLLELWRQYFRYGYWTFRLFVKHRKIPTLRKSAPLLFITSVIGLFLVNCTWSIIWLSIYFSIILGVSVIESLKRKCNLIYLFLAFLTLHWAYGTGNLVSILNLSRIKFKSLSLRLNFRKRLLASNQEKFNHKKDGKHL